MMAAEVIDRALDGSPASLLIRQIFGPIQKARSSVPMPAEPTHHQALSPSR